MIFPSGSDGKEPACNSGDLGSIPGLGRYPEGGNGNPFQYSCLENPHGQRSLVGYSPWGLKELDMNKWLSTMKHLSQSLICFLKDSLYCFLAKIGKRLLIICSGKKVSFHFIAFPVENEFYLWDIEICKAITYFVVKIASLYIFNLLENKILKQLLPHQNPIQKSASQKELLQPCQSGTSLWSSVLLFWLDHLPLLHSDLHMLFWSWLEYLW